MKHKRMKNVEQGTLIHMRIEQEIRERRLKIWERVCIAVIIILLGAHMLGLSCGRYLIP